jgi:hypothetical protein
MLVSHLLDSETFRPKICLAQFWDSKLELATCLVKKKNIHTNHMQNSRVKTQTFTSFEYFHGMRPRDVMTSLFFQLQEI